MKIVAIVPAKGTSDRIPSKNLMLIDGEPLVVRTIRRLQESRLFDEGWLDTESDAIVAACAHLHCSVMRRDPKLAQNTTDGHRLLLNEVEQIRADVYFQVLCTAPFLSAASLSKGIAILMSGSHDSVAGGYVAKLYEWRDGGPAYNIERIPNSVDLPAHFIESMGVYGITREAALRTKRRIGDRPYFLELSPQEVVDVNNPDDLALANLIAAGEREEQSRRLRVLRSFLSSAVLSDVMDELGAPGYFNISAVPNLEHSKILGRVKTLKLRPLEDGEDLEDIYKSLDVYKTLRNNEILWVENPLPYAFFGEINASLAIRCGASGAIVNGPTRDSASTRALGFPVFARGLSARDIRGRGTVDGINTAISVEGQTIVPGSLIFADSEGLVSIPHELEEKVLAACIERLETERGILGEISRGTHTQGIVHRFGNF